MLPITLILGICLLTTGDAYLDIVGKAIHHRSSSSWAGSYQSYLPDPNEQIKVNGTVVGYSGYFWFTYPFYLNIWRPLNESSDSFTFVGQVYIVPTQRGYNIDSLNGSLQVMAGDVMGFSQTTTYIGLHSDRDSSNCFYTKTTRYSSVSSPCLGCTYTFSSYQACYVFSFRIFVNSSVNPEGEIEQPPQFVGSPSLSVPFAASLVTSDGSVIVQSCESEFRTHMIISAQSMTAKMNLFIEDNSLCAGSIGLSLQWKSTSLTANGSMVYVDGMIEMPTNRLSTTDQNEICARQIQQYIENLSNWPQPIIPTVPGCPDLVFSPPKFVTESYEWCPNILPDQRFKRQEPRSGVYQQIIGYSPILRDARYSSSAARTIISDTTSQSLVDGQVVSWRAFIVVTGVTVAIRVWRPITSINQYILIANQQIYVNETGYHEVILSPPLTINKNDFIGLYQTGGDPSTYGLAVPYEHVPSENCFYDRQVRYRDSNFDSIGSTYSFNALTFCGKFSFEATIESSEFPDGSTVAPPSFTLAPSLTLTLTHNMTTVSGEAISVSCELSFQDQLQLSAQSMVSRVNLYIQEGIMCRDTSNVYSLWRLSYTTAQGPLLYLTIEIEFPAQREVILAALESCGHEALVYLKNPYNWPQPIIPDVTGCPALQPITTEFADNGMEWCKPLLEDIKRGRQVNVMAYGTKNKANYLMLAFIFAAVRLLTN